MADPIVGRARVLGRIQVPPALTQLLGQQERPTLGEIVRAERSDDNGGRVGLSLYESKFRERRDYRLWRLIRTAVGRELPEGLFGRSQHAVLTGLNSSDSVERWGIVCLLSAWSSLVPEPPPPPSSEQLIRISEGLERLLFSAPAPIVGAEKGCALAVVLGLDALQRVRYLAAGEHKLAADQVSSWTGTFEAYVKALDSEWEAGDIPDLTGLLSDQRPLFPWSQDDLLGHIGRALFNARAFVRHNYDEPTKEYRSLLRTAAFFAWSGWAIARELRLAFESTHRPSPPSRELAGLLRGEAHALRRAALARRDYGALDAAAVLNQSLLHLITRIREIEKEAQVESGIDHDTRFKNIDNMIAASIRQAGFLVDGAVAPRRTQPSPTLGKLEENGKGPRKATNRKPPDPFASSLAHDVQCDREWTAIRRFLGVSRPDDPLTLLGRREIKRNRVLSATAFRLALSYGQLQTAAEILARGIALATSEIAVFARRISLLQRLSPFAVDRRVHLRWREALRAAWSSARLGEPPATTDEALTVHELLLNSYPALLSSSGQGGICALRYYDRLTPPMIREVGDQLIFPEIRRMNGGLVDLLRNRLRQLDGEERGHCVCVSIAELQGGQVVEIVAIGADAEDVYIHDVGLEPASSARPIVKATEWRLRRASQWALGRIAEIPGDAVIDGLARAIVAAARRVNPTVGVIVLAASPRLSSQPWQYILRRLLGEGMLLSLIPSAGWLADVDLKGGFHDEGRKEVVRYWLSEATDLQDVRGEIEKVAESAEGQLESGSVVLGHGGVPARGSPMVSLGSRQLDILDWMDVGEARVAIVHACHGGVVSSDFSGDLGGAPGISLSMGCRLFVSPVVEVSPDTAVTLHRALVGRNAHGVAFGERYLRAIESDPRVALYNLHGLPTEGRVSSRPTVPSARE